MLFWPIIVLKRQLANNDESLSSQIALLESELAAVIDCELEGIKICSRAQWLEEGKKPSRYFFKLEKERIEKNGLSSSLDLNNNEVFTLEEIESTHMF